MQKHLLILIGLVCPLAAAADQRAPNIVLIMADDVSWECFGCYGAQDYDTPNIDRLATQGVRFTHCYSQPICTPSRVKIMTGQYNFRNYTHFGYLNPKDKTFGHLMQQAGYKTAVAGKWQLNGLYHRAEGSQDATRPLKAGFDEALMWQVTLGKSGAKGGERYWSPPLEHNGKLLDATETAGKYGPDLMSDFVCDFIERHKDEPFFVYYPTVMVHDPFVPTPDTIGNQPRSQAANEPPKPVAARKKNFVAMMTYMDQIVGKIVSKVEEVGQSDNTLILFTSDNGTHTTITSRWDGQSIRGGKGKTTDMGTHVPLVANWKEHTPEGVVSDELIDFTDFYTTIADVAGIEMGADDPMDGVSFYPQLQGQPGTPRDWVLCHYQPYWGKFRSLQFIRNQTYKLYRDGRFYEVSVDLKEEHDLAQGSLIEQVATERRKLNDVLEKDIPLPPKDFGRRAKKRAVYPDWKRIVK